MWIISYDILELFYLTNSVKTITENISKYGLNPRFYYLKNINRTLALLDEDDDVQEVYHNWDEPDEEE